MAKVKLARGTQTSYNSLQNKDSDTIYVCTNTGNLYLGSTPLFESTAYIDATINGKVVTFTTHGNNGTAGSDTLDLSVFQTASEVSTAISTAISSVFKPSGSLIASEIQSSLLISDNLGNVYNITESFTTTSDFIEGDGKTYPAGINIVIVNTGTSANPVYKFDVLAGFVDLSGYATKVSGATSGNFAGLDANGNLTDSGSKASDFKTKQTAQTDPTASGTTITAIATITQNENGVITATKKTIQDGTTSQKGIVQLSSAIDSTSDTLAATPSAVKSAYDLADGKVSDVKIGTSSIVSSKVATIITESAYDATTNKIATMQDIADSEMTWGTF